MTQRKLKKKRTTTTKYAATFTLLDGEQSCYYV